MIVFKVIIKTWKTIWKQNSKITISCATKNDKYTSSIHYCVKVLFTKYESNKYDLNPLTFYFPVLVSQNGAWTFKNAT